MYFKKPVIVRIRFDSYGICEAVMELYHANVMIKRWKDRCRKIAHDRWFLSTKHMFQCLMCCEDDPDTLQFHHIGEEYTGMPKKRSISSMVSRQLPLFEIEVEMSKCAVLCASCHQKVHHEGKEAIEDLYNLGLKYYSKYYAPGEENEDTRINRRLFRKTLKNLPIDIVAELNPSYLNKHDKGLEYIDEKEQEKIYSRNRYDLQYSETSTFPTIR